MYRKILKTLAVAALPLTAVAGPLSLDGVIGAEWAGVAATQVLQSATAPEHNFQSPTNLSKSTGYEILVRSDADYLYTALRTTGVNGGDAGGMLTANLYYVLRYGPGTYGTGFKWIGFELTNDRAFEVGGPGGVYYTDTVANLIQFATVDNSGSADVIEAAIDLSVFTDNALGVPGYGLPAGETIAGIRLNLSQSFGYSVAGGQAFYGDERLGFAPLVTAQVPEPGALALAATALVALAATRRRRA